MNTPSTATQNAPKGLQNRTAQVQMLCFVQESPKFANCITASISKL